MGNGIYFLLKFVAPALAAYKRSLLAERNNGGQVLVHCVSAIADEVLAFLFLSSIAIYLFLTCTVYLD